MYDRRTVLAGTFGVAAALAGCQGSGDSETPSGTPTGTATPAQTIDYGDWFADTDNFDGTTVDMRGQSSVTVSVGAQGNSGDFAFDPPAVHVDPGTTVVWEWTGNGGSHNVVADDGSFRSGDPTSSGTFEHTFDTEGIHLYFCDPHDSLGMRGAVVVGDPSGGGGGGGNAYGFDAASFDAYWYSLYNMSTNIAMSGNGVPFPLNEQMEKLKSKRMPAMLQNSEVDQPPIANPNLSLAAFTEGDPSFTQQPVLSDDSGRPDASTLAWDKSQSSGIVSPSSVGWTHLKGVTWAKNFQAHFDLLPQEMAPKFRAQLLSTLAQVGINAAILVGGSRGNGALTHGDTFEFLSEYRPSAGEIVDDTRRPHHHAAMLWFLSDMNSLAQNGWFGYENPKPLVPANAGDDAVFDPPVGIQG
ncbi:halocyanin domain-containing protein, partial [Halorientalis sp.]|uniref:halocyanin domain-containing protein n=1 Tax=Halorientalis sp. TaxID=1931229 RepID=UPI002626A63D